MNGRATPTPRRIGLPSQTEAQRWEAATYKQLVESRVYRTFGAPRTYVTSLRDASCDAADAAADMGAAAPPPAQPPSPPTAPPPLMPTSPNGSTQQRLTAGARAPSCGLDWTAVILVDCASAAVDPTDRLDGSCLL